MTAGADAPPLQVPHERLVRHLVKLLSARRGATVVCCTCASRALRGRIEGELRARLHGPPVVSGDLSGTRDPWADMLDARRSAGERRDAILSFGLPRGAETGSLDRLNFGREHLGREGLRLLLWSDGLTQEERLRLGAPDLWVYRADSLVFLTAEEFELPPPGEAPRALLEALREIDTALSRETVVGNEREMLVMMRGAFLFFLGESPSRGGATGPVVQTIEAHLAAAHDVATTGDLGAMELASKQNTLAAEPLASTLSLTMTASALWARGRVADAERALEEVAATQRRWVGGEASAFLDRAARLQEVFLRGDLGRHRALLAADVSFAPTPDAPPAAVALIWLGSWPPAIFTRACALSGSGRTVAALREVHSLLKTLVELGARRYIAVAVDLLVGQYVALGLPAEALSVLDLTDRDDLRPPGAESDLRRARLRAMALRAAGDPAAARNVALAACTRAGDELHRDAPEAARIHREHLVLRLRAEFDGDAEVAEYLAALRDRARAAGLADSALAVADTLRAHLERRGRHANALVVCREALRSLDDAWGPSVHARWGAHAARTLLADGRAAEALAEADLALDLWRRDPPPLRALPLRRAIAETRARALAALARHDDAVCELRDVVDLHRAEGATVAAAGLLCALAELPLPDAHRPACRAAAREALELARDAMHLGLEARALLDLASLDEPEAPSARAQRDEGLWLARASGDEDALRCAAEVGGPAGG